MINVPPTTPSARSLRDTIVEEARACVEDLAARFFPALELPGYCLGQRVTTMDRADFAYLLVHLYQLGVETVARTPIRDAVRRLLRPIDGPATTTFYSYRIAESLLAFGPSFEDNPLLEGFSFCGTGQSPRGHRHDGHLRSTRADSSVWLTITGPC